MSITTCLCSFLATLVLLVPAAAEEVVFTVGGDKSAGKEVASAGGGKWSKKPTKAFKWAAEAVNEGGARTVVVRIAEGAYDGDLGSGAFIMPSFKNPEATLRLEGGWNADFSVRDPYGTPSRFITVDDRHAELIQFRKSKPTDQDELAALVIDGLLLDVSKSNRYDSKTNSLLKGSSSSAVVITFGYLRTDLLEITNCLFMNSPHRAFETLIRAASDDAVIRLHNTTFLNCVIPVKLDSARYRHKPARIEVDHCSFLLNWAYNPDPNTSNPAALELGPSDAAEEIVLTNNLFYSNFGGAILALHKKLPSLTLLDNNFVGNGLLHGQTEPEAVAMIVEAGGKKQPIDVETIEELDAVDDFEGNVSVAPGLPLALGEVQTVDASEVQPDESWQNEWRRMLGLNLQGGTVEIKDYAPYKEYDPARPLVPVVADAQRFGASPALARQ